MNNFALEQYLNQYLNSQDFQDYTVNGLQVQGKEQVQKIVTGVTASQELIDYAIAVKADAILVHHGYFWKGSDPRITGYHYQRIKKLISHDINLYAYHLPVDYHPEIGNNVALAHLFNLDNHVISGNIVICELSKPIKASDLYQTISQVLQVPILHVSKNCPEYITKVGICSGGGQNFIDQAFAKGCDAYISGEISEQTYHSAVEQGIHYFQCTHHASERYGIKLLGEKLAKELNLEVEFKDMHNPA
ncbi:Nif3-like dinuclear metal center hexameric protein [Psittacicella hinzii]|uniref:GTP cyclohydrolase 1 type 2 homolog n=1 Tax=Psittacicella hinzii TaxID=2028575 RepID=A0A3A1YEV9_9GAMM|nr:Nif3-like dinuclear metal center hexameric protein [Psittacicella hinzii]RIY36773.1 Nif3-like dinuclear metal center hexameric protein [Psittacicella hinzii]